MEQRNDKPNDTDAAGKKRSVQCKITESLYVTEEEDAKMCCYSR